MSLAHKLVGDSLLFKATHFCRQGHIGWSNQETVQDSTSLIDASSKAPITSSFILLMVCIPFILSFLVVSAGADNADSSKTAISRETERQCTVPDERKKEQERLLFQAAAAFQVIAEWLQQSPAFCFQTNHQIRANMFFGVQVALETLPGNYRQQKEDISLCVAVCIGFQDITHTAKAIFEAQNHLVSRLLMNLFLEVSSPKNAKILKIRASNIKLANTAFGEDVDAVSDEWPHSCKDKRSQYFTDIQSESFQETFKRLPTASRVLCLHLDRSKETMFVVVVDCMEVQQSPSQEGISVEKFQIQDQQKLEEAVGVGRKLTTSAVPGQESASNSNDFRDLSTAKTDWMNYVGMVRRLSGRLCKRFSSLLQVWAVKQYRKCCFRSRTSYLRS